MVAHKGIQAYRQGTLKTTVAAADPHRVIQMLMEGALSKLAEAKGHIVRREMEAKAMTLSKVSAIINALNDGLDQDNPNEITNNLASLYEFMLMRVGEAGIQMDVSKIDEVIQLLVTIKSAWDQISESEKQKGYELQAQRDAAG